MRLEIRVPDIGEFDEVDVVEVLVEPGTRVERDDSLVTLESDKASMDLPAPADGVLVELAVSPGDRVTEGQLVAVLDSEAGSETEPAPDSSPEAGPPPSADRPREAASPEAPPEVPGTVSPSADRPREAASPEAPPEVPDTFSPPSRDRLREATPPAAPAIASESASGVRSAERPARLQDPERDTDVLVLGAGPGGYTAAFRAADLGLRVTLVERYESLGGVCLNVGCIPSKALLHLAEVLGEIEELADKGIDVDPPRPNPERIRLWKDRVVGRLARGIGQMAEQRSVRVVQGLGRFADPHAVSVETSEGKRRITFAAAVVAAGSRATAIPGLPDDARVWTSTEALELRDIPGRLLVIGAGVIGLEMATVYDALGAKVTVVEMLDRVLAGCDAELTKPLLRRLRRRYAGLHLATRVASVKAQKRGLRVTFEGADAPEPALFDAILVATGRRPNGDLLELEAAGVVLDSGGRVPVDDQQRTNVPHIFAIGDVTGEPMLAHRASHQGKVAAEVVAGLSSGFDATVVPAVAYTDPEVAWVGLGEEAAERAGREVAVASFPWSASGRSLALGRSDGVTRLIFDPESRRLLGGGVVGPRAGDLIAEIALAIEMGADAEDVALTVHPHPTLSETVALAAEVFAGTITDLYLAPGAKKPRRRRRPS